MAVICSSRHIRMLQTSSSLQRRLALLLAYVKSAQKCRDYDQQLGYELAKLHQADTTAFTCGHRFGFLKDNYAGSTRQRNHPSDSWIDFFRTQRLQPTSHQTRSTFVGSCSPIWKTASSNPLSRRCSTATSGAATS